MTVEHRQSLDRPADPQHVVDHKHQLPASSDPGPAATATLTNANNVQPTTKYTSAVFRLDRQPCCSLTGSWKYSTILGDYGMSAPASPTPVEVFSTSMLPGVTVPATPLPVGPLIPGIQT